MNRSPLPPLLALVALLLGGIAPAAGQALEPKAVRLRLSGLYIGVGVEAENQEDRYSDGSSATYERTFIGPVLGLRAFGSFYHPNFMRFTFNGEIWPGFSSETSTSAVSTERNESRFLGNYNANLLILAKKPYRSLVTVNQSYTYRDFDFFSRAEVNTFRIGLNTGYQSGPFPFTIDVWRRHEESTGQNIDSLLDETGLTFTVRNPRPTGETTFEYRFLNYDRADFSVGGSYMENTFSLADRETFGSRQQIHLGTGVSYSYNDYSEGPGDDLYASANLDVEHNSNLTSGYGVNYSRATSDVLGGETESDGVSADASLRHQLYESLTSTLRFEASSYSSQGAFDTVTGPDVSESTTSRFGGGLTEAYHKKLGSIGRLSLVGSFLVEHNSVDNDGGYIVRTDEPHVFTSDSTGFGTDTFFLSLPSVDRGSIVVTDAQNSRPVYREGRDYTVAQNGSLTEIRRPGTSTIPRNATVLIDYRALASPSGDYDSFAGFANLRVDLWNGLLSFYARSSSIRNNAPPELIVQDMEAYAVGVESSWRWLRAGAELENSNSNFSSYRSARFFQGISLQPTRGSSLSINFIESQTEYLDADRDEQNYYAVAVLRGMITRNLSANLDAGISLRRGEGVDQSLATLRPSIDFRVGRITLKAGYNYEYSEYLNTSEQERHFVYITLRRYF